MGNSEFETESAVVQLKSIIKEADRKNKIAARPLIGRDIFDFSSETTEWNSTYFDRKQDLSVI